MKGEPKNGRSGAVPKTGDAKRNMRRLAKQNTKRPAKQNRSSPRRPPVAVLTIRGWKGMSQSEARSLWQWLRSTAQLIYHQGCVEWTRRWELRREDMVDDEDD